MIPKPASPPIFQVRFIIKLRIRDQYWLVKNKIIGLPNITLTIEYE